ncbi:hypothetical protein ACFL4K_00055 [Candidatus Neomarinimicrobiota bacterium]
MKDDISAILFLKASGWYSEKINNAIGFETGYLYWDKMSPTLSSTVPEGWDYIAKNPKYYPEYEKRLSQEPFDEIWIAALIDSEEKRLTINTPDELTKFNKLGEEEYLHKHNLCLYRAKTSQREKLAALLYNDQLGNGERRSVMKKLEAVETEIKQVSDWLMDKGYEDEIITEPKAAQVQSPKISEHSLADHPSVRSTHEISPRKKGRSSRKITQFNIEPSTQWHDVIITFIDVSKLIITAEGMKKTYHINQLGLASNDGRSPGVLGTLLLNLAANDGTIDKRSLKGSESTTPLKNQISNLRKRLKEIIPINDNPITYLPCGVDKKGDIEDSDWDKHGHVWQRRHIWSGEYRTKFTISASFGSGLDDRSIIADIDPDDLPSE